MLEALSHVDDRAHDCRVIGIGSDLVDKGLVNFEDINGKLPKIAQAGIAGAEVIHGKMYAHHFKLLKNGGRGFGVVHKNAFGELEFKIACFQASSAIRVLSKVSGPYSRNSTAETFTEIGNGGSPASCQA